jgi:hypothetical protein
VTLTSATGTSLTLNLAPANRCNFQIRATDSLGRKGAWTPEVAFTLNVQETSASYVGTWVSSHSLGRGRSGELLHRTERGRLNHVQGRNLAWIGTKGPGYGSAEVYVDGVYWKTIGRSRPRPPPDTEDDSRGRPNSVGVSERSSDQGKR